MLRIKISKKEKGGTFEFPLEENAKFDFARRRMARIGYMYLAGPPYDLQNR